MTVQRLRGIGLELHRSGTMVYDSGGDFYMIASDTPDSYQYLFPVRLHDQYKVNGLRLSFIATTREDYYALLPASITSVAVPVELLSITTSDVTAPPATEQPPEQYPPEPPAPPPPPSNGNGGWLPGEPLQPDVPVAKKWYQDWRIWAVVGVGVLLWRS